MFGIEKIFFNIFNTLIIKLLFLLFIKFDKLAYLIKSQFFKCHFGIILLFPVIWLSSLLYYLVFINQ